MAAIKVGKPQVRTDTAAHTKGVREGNNSGHHGEEPGLTLHGKSTARRSTGIRARARNPILPGMPNLSPA
jgi:hypothetical protein